MTRTVKLIERDPDHNQRLEFDRYRAKVNCMTAPEAAWVLYDAAPDDATKALEELLIAVEAVYRGETFALPRLVSAREKVRSNPTCAALIRQAERRDG
jgi:hypothetical protein